MRNRTVAKELQLRDHARLTHADAVALARQTDQVTRQVRQQQTASRPPAALQAVSDAKRSTTTSQSRPARRHTGKTERTPTSGPCPWCGGRFNHKNKRSACPADGKVCSSCQRTGHFASVCKSKPKSVHSVETCESSNPHPFLGATKSSTQGDAVPRWTVELTLCDTSVKFTIDTGADLSVIPKSTYDSLLNAPPLDTPPRPPH